MSPLRDNFNPKLSYEWIFDALPGPQGDSDYLASQDVELLFNSSLTVTSAANRQGIRLQGLPVLHYSRQTGGDGGTHPSNTIDHGYSVGSLNMNGDTPVLFPVDSPDAGGFVCPLTGAGISED